MDGVAYKILDLTSDEAEGLRAIQGSESGYLAEGDGLTLEGDDLDELTQWLTTTNLTEVIELETTLTTTIEPTPTAVTTPDDEAPASSADTEDNLDADADSINESDHTPAGIVTRIRQRAAAATTTTPRRLARRQTGTSRNLNETN